ncbi:hypothetical protein SSP531S_16060 [Streptomyces spongiicola]|uniref:Uncharacterized protein n=1 Tax=Streptomyces spongiicola TaxID=1690221 RepID=A0A388SWE4_9ACTN|nr:hypothetical protein SSP531S_16060 [Streptomyces spongiicola]
MTRPDWMFNPFQRDASWVAVPTEIAMGLEPERGALDHLHHFAGHDRREGRARADARSPWVLGAGPCRHAAAP